MIEADWMQSRVRILFWIIGPWLRQRLENDLMRLGISNYGYIQALSRTVRAIFLPRPQTTCNATLLRRYQS